MNTVLCTGCFDLLHRGHIQLFIDAKALGNKLVAGVNSDAAVRILKGPNRPIFNEASRVAMLQAVRWVDEVRLIEDVRVAQAIRDIKPAVWVKGGDWTEDKLDKGEVAAAKEVGARIVIIPLLPGFSSTSIIERITKAHGLRRS